MSEVFSKSLEMQCYLIEMALSDCFVIGAVLCGLAFIIALFLHDRKNPVVATDTTKMGSTVTEIG